MVEYQSMRNTCTVHLYKKSQKIIKYKKKSWKMALQRDESLTKDETVLLHVYIVIHANVYMNISHPSWVNTSV